MTFPPRPPRDVIKRLAFLCVALASAARAQDDRIPIELLSAALRAHNNSYVASREEPVVTVGKIPADLAATVGNPPRARILGTVTYSGMTDIVGIVPGPPEAVLQWLSDDFRRRGFLPAPVSERYDRGGFFPPFPETPTVFCHDKFTYGIFARQVAAGVEYRIRVTPPFNTTAVRCGYEQMQSNTFGGSTSWSGDPITLPKLLNPSFTNGMSCFRAGPEASTETRFQTSTTSSEVMEHYARQLTAQGWTRAAAEPPPAVSVWSKRDSSRSMTASLVVKPVVSGAGCKSAELQIFFGGR